MSPSRQRSQVAVRSAVCLDAVALSLADTGKGPGLAWRLRKDLPSGVVLESPHPEESRSLEVPCPRGGWWRVSLHFAGGDAIGKQPPVTMRVELPGSGRHWTAPLLDNPFVLGDLELNGEPLTITKAGLGYAGIRKIVFTPVAKPVAYFKRARRPDRLPVFGITDQLDFARETACTAAEPFADMMRYHRELGFTAVSWHAYAGCCTYPTAVGTHTPYFNWNDREHLRILAGNNRNPSGDLPAFEFCRRHDQIELGTRLAHQEGLQFLPCFRVNNEWGEPWLLKYISEELAVEFWQPAFFRQHPEYRLQYKDGTFHGSGLCFSHAAVRRYRLGIIREVMENYPAIDGIFLDLHRNPPMVDYPDSLVAQFQKRYGADVRRSEPLLEHTTDPRWLAMRARPFTEFLRQVKTAKTSLGKEYPTVLRTDRTMAGALLDGVDLRAILRERLADTLILELHHSNDYETSFADLAAKARAAGLSVLACFQNPSFVEKDWPSVAGIAERWMNDGAQGLAFYESNRLVCRRQLRENLPGWLSRITPRSAPSATRDPRDP